MTLGSQEDPCLSTKADSSKNLIHKKSASPMCEENLPDPVIATKHLRSPMRNLTVADILVMLNIDRKFQNALFMPMTISKDDSADVKSAKREIN